MTETTDTAPMRGFKRYLPASLLGRALLILVIPTIAVQLVAIYIFYERHWDSVVRNMSASLAGEVALLVHEVHLADAPERNYRKQLVSQLAGMKVSYLPREAFEPLPMKQDARFSDFSHQLRRRISYPFSIAQMPSEQQAIRIQVALPDILLQIEVNKKRLVSSTTIIFVLWVVGSAALLLLVAILFLRNQIRPITQLSRAAEGFGMGHDMPGFRPSGAQEVRQAGRAFLTMRERITRQIATRTTMLSGISHDLRTPLTRMKLALEMQGDSGAVKALRRDVEEMQHMVQEYLDFVRGEAGEEPQELELNSYLETVVQPHAQAGEPVTWEASESARLLLRPVAFKRALDNLIVNAVRYGGQAHLSSAISDDFITLWVEDEGPGIPESLVEEAFRPFRRLDAARSPDTGGAGLGLTIARDIIRAHGGDITLKNRMDAAGVITGLQVQVRVPLARE